MPNNVIECNTSQVWNKSKFYNIIVWGLCFIIHSTKFQATTIALFGFISVAIIKDPDKTI